MPTLAPEDYKGYEHKIFVAPAALYDFAVEYFKEMDVIVIKNKLLPEGAVDFNV